MKQRRKRCAAFGLAVLLLISSVPETGIAQALAPEEAAASETVCEQSEAAEEAMTPEVSLDETAEAVTAAETEEETAAETEEETAAETEEETAAETEEEAAAETEEEAAAETEEEAAEAKIYDAFCENSAISEDELRLFDFSSKEIIIGTEDESQIIDSESILDSGSGMYVLRYETEEYAKNAFSYYYGKVDFVAPNILVKAADGEGGAGADVGMPLDTLSEIGEASTGAEGIVIAVIDSGMPEHANVTNRVSVINGGAEAGDDNGHGTAVLNWILEVNPDAEILSIKALDSNGKGDAVSICAGIEYARSSGAEIILLPLYAYAAGSNAAIANAVSEAIASGAAVVGAAGNDGANVKYYVPGNLADAYIAGACNERGEKRDFSNFGSTVDYNVIAESTSEASAKMAAFLSSVKDGYAAALEKAADEQVLFFRPDEFRKEETEGTAEIVRGYEIDQTKNAVVRYTFIDKSMLSGGETWADLMDGDRSKLIATLVSETAVYRADDGSYRFTADAPWRNGTAAGEPIAWVFANGNNRGQTLTDGVSFNPETKVAAVSESVLGRAEGDFSDIQMQILVPVYLGTKADIPVLIESNGERAASTMISVGLFKNPAFTMLVSGSGEHITKDDLAVYIGDIRIGNEEFAFDEATGTVMVSPYAINTGSIRVVIGREVQVDVKAAMADYYSPLAEYQPSKVAFWLPAGTDVSRLKVNEKITADCYSYDEWNRAGRSGPEAIDISCVGLCGSYTADPNGYSSDWYAGAIAVPKNLFGVDFQFCNEDGTPMGNLGTGDDANYNVRMAAYCSHEPKSAESAGVEEHKLSPVYFQILDKTQLSDGTLEFVMAYECRDYAYILTSNPDLSQNLAGVIRFRVKPAGPAGYLRAQKVCPDACIPTGTDAYPLAGIKFDVYEDEACTKPAKDVNGNTIRLTSGTDGLTDIVEVEVDQMNGKDFWVRENETSLKGTAWVYNPEPVKIHVTKDSTATAPAVAEVPNYGNMDPIGILVQKLDKKTGREVRRVEQ